MLLAVIGGKAEESESFFQQSIDILEGISGLQPIRLAKTFLVIQQYLKLIHPLLLDEPCSVFSHFLSLHSALFPDTMAHHGGFVCCHGPIKAKLANNALTPPMNAGLCRPPKERIAPPGLRDPLSALL